MLPRTLPALVVIAATSTLLSPALGPASASGSAPPAAERGTPRWMEIDAIDGGWRYRASQVDNRLTLTRVGDRVRFADTASRTLRTLPAGCRRAPAETGLAVTCRIPASTSAANPLLLEIVPRLGDDRVDGSALGAELRLSVLGDDGNEVVLGGAAADFVNGALGADQVHGGNGADWIRTGPGNDTVDGGEGADRLVGTTGNDHLTGGNGDDRLEGGDGDDLLLSGAGEDILLCGEGTDTTDDDNDLDTVRHCENTLP